MKTIIDPTMYIKKGAEPTGCLKKANFLRQAKESIGIKGPSEMALFDQALASTTKRSEGLDRFVMSFDKELKSSGETVRTKFFVPSPVRDFVQNCQEEGVVGAVLKTKESFYLDRNIKKIFPAENQAVKNARTALVHDDNETAAKSLLLIA